MATRDLKKLRFVKDYGVCVDCGKKFTPLGISLASKSQITDQFREHKCKKLDASQNALRVVREATED
jgi:predicted transcriptional regulator